MRSIKAIASEACIQRCRSVHTAFRNTSALSSFLELELVNGADMEETGENSFSTLDLLKLVPEDYDGEDAEQNDDVFSRLRDIIHDEKKTFEKSEEQQLKVLKILFNAKLNKVKRKKKRAAADDGQAPVISDEKARISYSGVVFEFLKCKVSKKAFIRFLTNVDTKVLPNMHQPLALADFLVNSFSKGGLISVLALSGLFTLIQEYHLDFPDFYGKFYSLLTPEVLGAKYRARFFFLADRFMSSSHIPSYTVAAVAKKLSRLSLFAPADSLSTLLTLVINLVIRHPSLEGLVHNVKDTTDMEKDPFVFEELDMTKCRALESSLWELKTLQSHYSATVAELASMLDSKLPEVELDITEQLETTAEEMTESVFAKPIPTSERSKGLRPSLFSNKDVAFSSFWAI